MASEMRNNGYKKVQGKDEDGLVRRNKCGKTGMAVTEILKDREGGVRDARRK